MLRHGTRQKATGYLVDDVPAAADVDELALFGRRRKSG
jgi:hypothetical protein